MILNQVQDDTKASVLDDTKASVLDDAEASVLDDTKASVLDDTKVSVLDDGLGGISMNFGVEPIICLRKKVKSFYQSLA